MVNSRVSVRGNDIYVASIPRRPAEHTKHKTVNRLEIGFSAIYIYQFITMNNDEFER